MEEQQKVREEIEKHRDKIPMSFQDVEFREAGSHTTQKIVHSDYYGDKNYSVAAFYKFISRLHE